jgi:hypothetical protein
LRRRFRGNQDHPRSNRQLGTIAIGHPIIVAHKGRRLLGKE